MYRDGIWCEESRLVCGRRSCFNYLRGMAIGGIWIHLGGYLCSFGGRKSPVYGVNCFVNSSSPLLSLVLFEVRYLIGDRACFGTTSLQRWPMREMLIAENTDVGCSCGISDSECHMRWELFGGFCCRWERNGFGDWIRVAWLRGL